MDCEVQLTGDCCVDLLSMDTSPVEVVQVESVSQQIILRLSPAIFVQECESPTLLSVLQSSIHRALEGGSEQNGSESPAVENDDASTNSAVSQPIQTLDGDATACVELCDGTVVSIGDELYNPPDAAEKSEKHSMRQSMRMESLDVSTSASSANNKADFSTKVCTW